LIKKILDGEEIKKILYFVIEDEVGKKKIQTEITSDIRSSQKYMDIIMSRSVAKISAGSNEDSIDDYFHEKLVATLSEALLHFMLTICTLPSERRITLKDDLVLDVVVPNLQRLKTEPEKSVIIQFIKGNDELSKISRLESIQPNNKNIWLISIKPLSLRTKYITYHVLSNSVISSKYSNIIIDIYYFLKQTGDKSFRFIH
jgi:hypothetical protein